MDDETVSLDDVVEEAPDRIPHTRFGEQDDFEEDSDA
jgi:hypothetical protein